MSVVTRVPEIRGLVLVDRSGLPLVSTLGTGALEEGLAAFAAVTTDQIERAQRDFQMGPLYLMHLVGRDRQLYLTPLTPEVALTAIVDAGATASTVTLHLLGMCREILAVLMSGGEDGVPEDGA
jgi:predicted regulator of Ras-like GTPase activity (Roadblock/LC7/MglB family)